MITKEFSIHGEMRCGSHEAEVRRYKMIIGKSGLRWLISIQPNEGDNIYVEGKEGSDGFGGRTLNFELETGEIVSLVGPWHSNADALFFDTGYDAREKYLTFGIVALKREFNEKNMYGGDIYVDVLYEDIQPVVGRFDRIKSIAQKLSNEMRVPVFYSTRSQDGGSSSQVTPENVKGESSE